MIKIIHKKKECISCGSCAVLCPQYFEMGGDNFAELKGSRLNGATGNQELEISEKTKELEDAAQSCPVQIIILEEK
ncbi:MAG: hypothetical protein A3H02_02585 [Candidatus Niyogibacteria bacterium RIFCSPLOWO2_12_FULL_41_13]|uniref:Ferredoxin n=1 Tax=Candidatus Niyogibacteria bacterium RIFCSPLOWO2_12_FULL_41_13 TaxID=1801726 RepID=A0A1G2F1X9_9BACT|nr:MAG: hypothetical protein A3H02_02585 [Candidatus Niyogibacteria bacterium RIFCSPLOWO2_12_FULL_41_13]